MTYGTIRRQRQNRISQIRRITQVLPASGALLALCCTPAGAPSAAAAPAAATSPAPVVLGADFDHPQAVCVTEGRVFVADAASNRVTIVSEATGQVAGTVVTGYTPYDVACVGDAVWVVNHGIDDPVRGTVTEINATTGAIVRQLHGSAYQFLGGQAIAADAGHVWVDSYGGAGSADDNLTEIDAATGAAIAVQQLPDAVPPGVGLSVAGMLSDDGTNLWYTSAYGDTVTEVSDASGAVVRTIPVAGAPRAISADGTHVWVASTAGLVEIDAATGAVAATNTALVSSAVDSDGTHVWVSGNHLYELDAATGARIATVSSPAAVGSSVATDGTDTWVANPGADQVAEVAVSTHTLTRVDKSDPIVFEYPNRVYSDGTHLWVAYQDDDLAELSSTTGTLVRVFTDPSYKLNDILGVWSNGADAWITSEDGITEIDAATGKLIQVLPSIADDISGIATTVWCAAGGELIEIDAATGRVSRTIPDTLKGTPTAMAVDGSHVWVAGGGDSPDGPYSTGIAEFSIAAGAQVATIPAKTFEGGHDFTPSLASDGTHLWVASHGVEEINESTLSATGHFPALGSRLAFDGTHLFATYTTKEFASGVAEIDPATMATVKDFIGPAFNFGADAGSLSADGAHVWVQDDNGETVTGFAAS